MRAAPSVPEKRQKLGDMGEKWVSEGLFEKFLKFFLVNRVTKNRYFTVVWVTQ